MRRLCNAIIKQFKGATVVLDKPNIGTKYLHTKDLFDGQTNASKGLELFFHLSMLQCYYGPIPVKTFEFILLRIYSPSQDYGLQHLSHKFQYEPIVQSKLMLNKFSFYFRCITVLPKHRSSLLSPVPCDFNLVEPLNKAEMLAGSL